MSAAEVDLDGIWGDEKPNGTRPAEQEDARPEVSQRFIELARQELTDDALDAIRLGERLEDRWESERVATVARRIVRDDQLAREADLHGVDVVTAATLLAREMPKRRTVFGDLLQEGHNAVVVARFKAGKSTLVENMAKAAASGDLFLARFPVPEPLRVVLMNYELDDHDMRARIRGLELSPEAQERLLVLNLRGRRLPVMTPTGRDWLAGVLADHRADLLLVDPFGAAYAAAGGVSENDNAEVRRFTTALDEIKRLGGCRTLVMPVHTGRGEQHEGDERGRGATVIDDWPDVRMLLTVDDKGDRYLRTDGRAFCLAESRLGFDPNGRRLMLATTDLGVSRRSARRIERQALVVEAVAETPGINSRELREHLGANGIGFNDDKTAAIKDAREARLIHVHAGARAAHLHYPGEPHLDEEHCPGGWSR